MYILQSDSLRCGCLYGITNVYTELLLTFRENFTAKLYFIKKTGGLLKAPFKENVYGMYGQCLRAKIKSFTVYGTYHKVYLILIWNKSNCAMSVWINNQLKTVLSGNYGMYLKCTVKKIQ